MQKYDAAMAPSRPADLHDRRWEWDALARFATDDREGATLGVVAGRRRQGKSFLLQALCEATGGLYVEALEGTRRESLALLGDRIGRHTGALGPVALPSWEAAVEALLALGRGPRPVPVVLDELPYLVRAAPELPSVLQAAFGPRTAGRRRSRTRLILCGSALSFMGRLLGADAPLRGRAGLELVVNAFGYRDAAEFWGAAAEPALALRVSAIVGGTPAYRREFVGDDAPDGLADFDDWVVRSVLNPALPLFREGRYLLADEGTVRDPAIYHAVLAAVTAGHRTRGGIASAVGRASNELTHPIAVLEDTGYLARDTDLFRSARPTYRITEPFLAFHHAVLRPRWARLARPGRARETWSEAQATFSSAVLGPHFEQLCREWTSEHAAADTLGGTAARVGRGVVGDRAARAAHEVDVVALGEGGRVLLLGEAKVGAVMGVGHLERLRRIRSLLVARGVDAAGARLACFGGGGSTSELRGEHDAVVVDLARLYSGT